MRKFLNQHIKEQAQHIDNNIEIIIDGVLAAGGVTVALAEILQNHVGPFGQEQPEPVFMLKNIRIHKADILGGAHIRIIASDREGGGRIKGMAFRAADTPLGTALLTAGVQDMHIAGHIKINEWQGRKSAEMHITDAAFAENAKMAAA